ncbi:unnamed protein product [Soboliphyme baturini]|uniref:F-box domain-containing protein n=1 Tax=Soboliphyme baturini TaxID=241478 RepID=A0A183J2F1_9BILA|nr:unnamed protein product [Soboliphyme baturini]
MPAGQPGSTMDNGDTAHEWSSLPVVILAKVFGYLSLADVGPASQVCKHWFRMLGRASTWHRIEFDLFGGMAQERWQLRVVQDIVDRGIRSLTIVFVGENPLFYAGLEFCDALYYFLAVDHSLRCTLESLNVSRMPVMFQDSTFQPLATVHWRTLLFLDLQNTQFICQVTPACLYTVVEACVELQDLRVSHFSMSDDVLMLFNDPRRRRPLMHLSLFCRRQEKYSDHDLSEQAWSAVAAHNKDLAVTLKFDFTCTLRKTRDILKPNIPIWNLFLENHVTAYEIYYTAQFYAKTLRKLVVQCRYNEDVQDSLLAVAEACRQLQSLHVMCVLDQGAIDRIFELLPQVRSSGNYTLKSDLEPAPWNTDEILDCLILPSKR